MAVVGHLHKIVFGGILCQTESWSASMHYLRGDAGAVPILGDLADAFTAWFKLSSSQISSYARLDYIKVNELNPLAIVNGGTKPASPPFTRYLASGAVNEVYFSPGIKGDSDQNFYLPQTTVCVSLTTGLRRGPAHAGRFYPPSCSGISADGRIGAADATGMALGAANLIADINASNGGLGGVVVYSANGPTTEPVTGTRVGRVVDTQRRRRRNLLEEYSLHDLQGF